MKFCFYFKGEYIIFSCQNELLFLKQSQVWKQNRDSVWDCWECFILPETVFTTIFLFCWENQKKLLIASPVLVRDSILKQAPAILVALHGNRWGSLLSKTISCGYRVFLFSPLLSHPICAFLLIFLPVVTRLKTSLSLSEKRACTVPLLCLTSLHLHQGWGIPQCLF